MCGIMGFAGNIPEESGVAVVLNGLKNLEYRGYDSSGIAYFDLNDNNIKYIKKSGKLINLFTEIAEIQCKSQNLPNAISSNAIQSNPISSNATIQSDLAIGHIRWATHGKPSDENAHPHLDCSGDIAIVHNGIIENYLQLKEKLLKNNHKFKTETDSEIIAHLIEDYILKGNSFLEAVRKSSLELKGSFAIAILYAKEKAMAAVKFGPPLVLAKKDKNLFVASDISALLEYSNDVIYLKNGEIAYYNDGKLDITNFKGKKSKIEVNTIKWDASKSAKSGFSHFMQKEIFEQPSSILEGFNSRILFKKTNTKRAGCGAADKTDKNNIEDIEAYRQNSGNIFNNSDGKNSAHANNADNQNNINNTNNSSNINNTNNSSNISNINNINLKNFGNAKIALEGLRLTKKDIASADRVIFIACGSSYYASLIIKNVIENLCGLPVTVDYGSEFRYGRFPVQETDIVVGVSQSGETADTNSALEIVRGRKAKIISICNVPGSQITTLSNKGVIYTHAGPEIGVASTKAFTSQVLCGILFALYLRQEMGINCSISDNFFSDLISLPQKIEEILSLNESIQNIAKKYYKSSNFLYLGRGILYPVALEGALKLKEISYIHAEGYPSGEMKHGPIALVDENMPVMFLLSNNLLAPKTISNIEEIKARGGRVIALADYDPDIKGLSDLIKIPDTSEILSPILFTVPLQLFAYHIAALKGTDIDQPRNLAKSVTVE
ncbi:MAG: glutamine--fructose-6-phosphate aminotransferase [Candidatus Acididesulfobacter diazotrophicus]|uniref:Glutamine--fructose-6-phosphate aminotransferase [isomerizing] n=1 Tax=Candidatus Acididesulfobacter diazotrophicus TaxID=2597226 RepID=A0A519BN39_9DELT|nr:MAG: glutamine--fructose-6-phosphate aminotransferase [Candidatus Acididesulfobacter diazotrophicus]